MNRKRDYLFLYGVSRSGTTALARTLNGHHEITMGIERFKRLWGRNVADQALRPDLFSRDRFFDFSDGYTNIVPCGSNQWVDIYSRMAVKYDSARYVGDKMTASPFPHVINNFPGVKIVCIVRDVRETAHSWQGRADRVKDRWPAKQGARSAVKPWNDSLRDIVSACRAYPQQVAIVEYRRFFSDHSSLLALLDFLELTVDDGIEDSWASASDHYLHRISTKRRSLPPEVGDFLSETADWKLWEQARAAAVGGKGSAQAVARDAPGRV